MLNNIRISRSLGYALIGLLAFSTVGCQEQASAPPSKTPTKTVSNGNSSSTKKMPPEIDPHSVADDGTVLLTPPKPPKSDDKSPHLDVIVDIPKIPEDAKFGEPTLADPPPTVSGQLVSGEPTLADSESADEKTPTPPTSSVVTEASDVQLTDPVEAPSVSASNAQAPTIGNLATNDELNQKIAEDWPKPQAVLLLTGQQHGYIEPCGCTGLDRQKGGIIRRDTLLTQLTDRGWPVVPLDVGNQVRRTGVQAELQFRVTANAFKTLGYKAATLGIDDLRLNSNVVVQVAGSDDAVQKPGMFISANTTVYGPEFWPKSQVVEAGGRKIGITAYLGEEFAGDFINNKGIQIADPVSSLQAVVKELKEQGCDYLVLLSHASQQDSEAMGAKVPGFDLIVTAGGHGEPRNVLDPIPGSTAKISQVGTKGMFACIVGLFDDAKTPVRYQRIAISSQFKDSPRMLEAFKQYQEQLMNVGFEGLKINYRPAPKSGEFVGSDACGDCHTIAFDVWENSKHFHATDSIIKPNNARGSIPRHFDPECVSCHVTGWDPQKYEPFETGYWSLEKTPKLVGSGCENCHGPGSEHVKAESGKADDALLNKLREQMRLPLKVAEAKCVECHDTDNSPDFKFDKYWEEVKHIGKD